MWKHLNALKKLGPCTIVTAGRRPVGMGWSQDHINDIRSLGFGLKFREAENRPTLMQAVGFGYGLICKSMGLNRAFGHSNPYHRYAFPEGWWWSMSRQADIAVINYSFWSYLSTACPKAIVLHDLISQVSWEGAKRETSELSTSDLVVVISKHEELRLNRRGICQTLWSPPSVQQSDFDLNSQIGMVGSENNYNIEGLRWLERAVFPPDLDIRVYGKLSRWVRSENLFPVGEYKDSKKPYADCGIILLTTSGGTGVQIKAIEALAAGRAIIARQGAFRGLPIEENAWIEVESKNEMLEWAAKLKNKSYLRDELSQRAKIYYEKHLSKVTVLKHLEDAYQSLSGQ